MTPLQKIIARLEATKNQSDFEISSNLLSWAKALEQEEKQMCEEYFTAGFMYSREGWNGETPFAGRSNEYIFWNIIDGYHDFTFGNG